MDNSDSPTPFAPASTAWPTAAGAAAGRTALVAGASGLVGQEILKGLLADERYAAVHAIGRRQLATRHPKLTSHTVDFDALPALPAVDDVYVALGTTIKAAGSEEAFRAIDFGAVVAVVQAARSSGATNLGVVSAMGANARSGVFYNHVKGEMENCVASLGFDSLVVVRPSLLTGDRGALKQPERIGERIAQAAMAVTGPLIPANYRAIPASKVARALLVNVPASQPGKRVLLSGELQHY